MKNICVAKETISLRFNTLSICLFKYVSLSYLKENRKRKSSTEKQKEKVMHSSPVRKMEKGVEEEQEALVTTSSSAVRVPLCIKGGRRCEKA